MAKNQTPQTLTDLSRVLVRHRSRGFIASDGGRPLWEAPSRVLIDVGGIRGFSAVTARAGTVTIGAGASFGEVLRQVEGENGLLKQAITMMANPLVRNRVTVFSALAADSDYLDLATALVTLGAKVRVQALARTRTLPIEDFLLAAAAGLQPGEYPASVEFKMLEPKWRVGFFRVNPGRGRGSVSASVRMRVGRNSALDPEIVVSSSTVIPVRVPAASRALKRLTLGDNDINRVAEIAAAEMLEMADVDADPYESSLIEVVVSRAIRRVNETALRI